MQHCVQTDTNWVQEQKHLCSPCGYLSPKDHGLFLSLQVPTGLQCLFCTPVGYSGWKQAATILTPFAPSLPSEPCCFCLFSFILAFESQKLSTGSSSQGSHGRGWKRPAQKNPFCDSSKHIQSPPGAIGRGKALCLIVPFLCLTLPCLQLIFLSSLLPVSDVLLPDPVSNRGAAQFQGAQAHLSN